MPKTKNHTFLPHQDVKRKSLYLAVVSNFLGEENKNWKKRLHRDSLPHVRSEYVPRLWEAEHNADKGSALHAHNKMKIVLRFS